MNIPRSQPKNFHDNPKYLRCNISLDFFKFAVSFVDNNTLCDGYSHYHNFYFKSEAKSKFPLISFNSVNIEA